MKRKRWPIAAQTDTSSPRAFLMASLSMADEHLTSAAGCVASGDVEGLREAFDKFIACTRASAETLADAIIEIERSR
ncbi:hypothetical protein [Bosea vaviloviae]|uniref:Uncharacterized protein n=1 Tax=Bosea vaviloviae TaxID=1526658 RepID=A0A0N1F315_9HYPH|nr:hypothetical protein [Bosea vaviloviae]KPH79340.1 hypothetical protein AE618_18745 [Bosea vaviloviae]